MLTRQAGSAPRNPILDLGAHGLQLIPEKTVTLSGDVLISHGLLINIYLSTPLTYHNKCCCSKETHLIQFMNSTTADGNYVLGSDALQSDSLLEFQ
jgi:hypothetical protein